ncbi:MAG: hypothetical protein LBR68_05920, partial [Lachnoclostridium sp.]|nr:hypothetical protein [Lachnoclostridium sp.]
NNSGGDPTSNAYYLSYPGNWAPGAGGWLNPAASFDTTTGLITSEVFNLLPVVTDDGARLTQEELDNTDAFSYQVWGAGDTKSFKISAIELTLKDPADPTQKPAKPEISWIQLEGEETENAVVYSDLPGDNRYNAIFDFAGINLDLDFTADGMGNQIDQLEKVADLFDKWDTSSFVQEDFGMFYVQAVGIGSTKEVQIFDAYEGSTQFARKYTATISKESDNVFYMDTVVDGSDTVNRSIITDSEDTLTIESARADGDYSAVIQKDTNEFELTKDGELYVKYSINEDGTINFEFSLEAAVEFATDKPLPPKPISVKISTDNVWGSASWAVGGATNNEDGSLTFNSTGSGGGGFVFHIDSVGKGGVDLTNYKTVEFVVDAAAPIPLALGLYDTNEPGYNGPLTSTTKYTTANGKITYTVDELSVKAGFDRTSVRGVKIQVNSSDAINNVTIKSITLIP